MVKRDQLIFMILHSGTTKLSPFDFYYSESKKPKSIDSLCNRVHKEMNKNTYRYTPNRSTAYPLDSEPLLIEAINLCTLFR